VSLVLLGLPTASAPTESIIPGRSVENNSIVQVAANPVWKEPPDLATLLRRTAFRWQQGLR
jgi:hypothetical protein